jgi:hypothetical protein
MPLRKFLHYVPQDEAVSRSGRRKDGFREMFSVFNGLN